MQLFKVKAKVLINNLSSVIGIVEKRHSLPILANVLINIEKEKISFKTTNLEIQIYTFFKILENDLKVDVSLTVSAKKLLDILKTLNEEEHIEVINLNEKLLLKTEKSKFQLQTLKPEDFPELKESQKREINNQVVIPQRKLKELLQSVQYAMAQQDIRYYLNGILLEIRETHLCFVATDGHRLAFIQLNIPTKISKDIIVPRKTVHELIKQLETSDTNLILSLYENQVKFSFNNVEILSKLIDGNFPDYRRVIPKHQEKRLKILRTELLRALQRVAILSNEKFRGVRWILSEEKLRIICTNSEQEEAEEEIKIEYKNSPLDIGFNINYLLDVLNFLEDEYIICNLGDPNSSMLITVEKDKNFKYVIMPMRI